MTTTSCPRFWVAMARVATPRIRSSVPTEVPPNFWTIRATTRARRTGRSPSCQSWQTTEGHKFRLPAAMSPVATYIVETLVTLLGVVVLAVLLLYGGRRLGVGRPS